MGLYTDRSMIYLKFSNNQDAANFLEDLLGREKKPLRDPSDYTLSNSGEVLDNMFFDQKDLKLIGTDVFMDADGDGKYRDFNSENMNDVTNLEQAWVVNYEGDYSLITQYDAQGNEVAQVSDSDIDYGPETWENYTRGQVRQVVGNILPPFHELRAEYDDAWEEDPDVDDWQGSWRDDDRIYDILEKLTIFMVKNFEEQPNAYLPEYLKDKILSAGIASTHYVLHEYFYDWLKGVYEDRVAKYGKENNIEEVLRKNMKRFGTKNMNNRRMW